MNVYLDWATKYFDCGYVPIPIKPGTKRPYIREWSTYCETTPSPELIDEWKYTYSSCGIGITCGKASNIVVFDYDNDLSSDEKIKIHEKMEPLLPKSPVIKKGARGFSAFFQYNGEKSEKFTDSNGSVIFELLSDNKQCVLPPTIHPDLGTPFEWVGEAGLELHEIDPKSLPILDKEIIQKLAEVLKPETTAMKERTMRRSKVYEPGRNSYLTSIAGMFRRKGMDYEMMLPLLSSVNSEVCEPPLGEDEVEAVARSVSKYSSDISWDKPKDLPSPLLPVQHLTEDLIPPPMRDWVKDISYQMNVPLDMVLPPALTIAGSFIGVQVGIAPMASDKSWIEFSNLWGATVLPSGQLKTPVLNQVSKPMDSIIAREHERYESAMKGFSLKGEDIEIEKELKKKELRAAKSEDPPDLVKIKRLKNDLDSLSSKKEEAAPKEVRYKINDGTIEKIAEILAEQNKTVLLYRDELTGLINQCSKPGRESDRDFFLEGWSNSRNYIIERITRGPTFIKHLSLSVLGGIQPSKLAPIINLAKEGILDDGLIQRFQLMTYPDLPRKWEKPKVKSKWIIRERMVQMFEALADLDRSGFKFKRDAGLQVNFKTFSVDAQSLFEEWFERHENRLRSREFADYPAFESHMSKYRGLVPSLALIYDSLNFAESKVSTEEVGVEAVEWAIAFTSYLESHAKRIYGYSELANLDGVHALAKKITSGKVKDGDTIRDIYRHHWKHLHSPEQVEKAISGLEEYGWVSIEKIGSGGRPSEVLRINPSLGLREKK